MTSLTRVNPALLRGTKDRLPDEMLRRNAVMQIIRDKFEKYGFSPIETPIICPAETIIGSDADTDKLIYRFKDRGQRDIALPYDLTVPFARFVATHYKKLPMPFKRYQLQRVWRAEKPQRGRLREFYQCDADIVGSTSLLCEAEILRLVYDVLSNLGVEFTIKLNSRRLSNQLFERYGIELAERAPALRIIDKYQRDGFASVVSKLSERGIDNATAIMTELQPQGDNAATLNALGAYDTSELRTLLEHCRALGIPDNRIVVDPTLTRGLDYYTGIVFEALPQSGELGALCAGGRYDNLCERFTAQAISGVGASFGFERIMLYLDSQRYHTDSSAQSPAQALIALLADECIPAALKMFGELQDANIATELYFEAQPLAKQLRYAVKQNIPFLIIQGPDELATDSVQIKRLSTGKQKSLPARQLINYLVNYYEA
ncbi:MAG: histidine--tRNA ligase [Bacillota bacterium]